MTGNKTLAPANRLSDGAASGSVHRHLGRYLDRLQNRFTSGLVDGPTSDSANGPMDGLADGSAGTLLPALVALGCLFTPGIASAHLVSTRFGELYSGILHPLTALAHIVPWLALGLLGGLQSPQTARHALLVFPLAVLGGLMLARIAPGLPFVVTFNLFTFILLGALVAFSLELGSGWFVGLVALVGLSHGYANAAEGLRGGPWILFILGVGLAAYVSITLFTSLAYVFSHDRAWARIAVRAIGSWIAAAGTMYLGFLSLAPQA